MNIYDCIKCIAEDKGISISDIEKACNIANGSISKWNKSVPKADTLYKVSKYLGTSIELFLSKEAPIEKHIDCETQETIIYETPYNVHRILKNKNDGRAKYYYTVEYEISIHNKIFPQTVILRPIKEMERTDDLIDSIFNGAKESKMYIAQTISTLKIDDEMTNFYYNSVLIQANGENGAIVRCKFEPNSEGSKETFTNLLYQLKGKGIIKQIGITVVTKDGNHII